MFKAIKQRLEGLNTFPFYYEIAMWFIFICIYKYSVLLDLAGLPNPNRDDFPNPELILFAIALSLYVIPFYRWIAPTLLKKKKHGWLALAIIFYFGIVCKVSNWVMSSIFYYITAPSPLKDFYHKSMLFTRGLLTRPFGWSPNPLLADIIVFLSVSFIWFAYENERKKHLLEKDNLVLQLESLKAQLHPHFLFNTLNNIYGMSLTGNKETPAFILKLSDMMRFILYDCQRNLVSLEKDIEFLENYLEMEKQRYPAAEIQFTVSGDATGKQIAPLLFIQFLENSFKHGAHRLNDTGFIHGSLRVEGNSLHFELRNDVFAVATPASNSPYGGVGIENVRKRLVLYYPGQHDLSIGKTDDVFEVKLTITSLSS
ncbi:sensor histidine kinase [Paraflavitalea pollutisoli]|uniref:sensor histidine kinase n=1 Tax=Paraflavitalea pollutisoli TaxID=3034143 RepID=UPI0023EB019B|nr:sensor histidine kinase [Paraflavitalea sp. H1-2-19X]